MRATYPSLSRPFGHSVNAVLNRGSPRADTLSVPRSRSALRALSLASVSALVFFHIPAQPAGAADLDELRARAQAVADEIGSLERRFLGLTQRQERLEAEITEANQKIALLELRVNDASDAYQAALDRYVERAVEIYKSGPVSDFGLLLGAQDFNDVFTITQASANAAELDADAMQELLLTKEKAAAAQSDVDSEKQRLLNARATAELVATDISATLETRRDLFDTLESEIALFEAEARRQAALAPNPNAALADLLAGTGPSDGIPNGFAGTGVVLEGTASWYGPGFEGNPTATGAIFDSRLYTAASKELPLNSWLFVQHESKGVVVLVNDRGPYVQDWILDLSHAAAQSIGITGIGWVSAEILIRI
jgi:peptidoglycan hydrolase CwlO-like protein